MGERIHLLFPRDFEAFVDGDLDGDADGGRTAAVAAALARDQQALARALLCRRINDALCATKPRLYADRRLHDEIACLRLRRSTGPA